MGMNRPFLFLVTVPWAASVLAQSIALPQDALVDLNRGWASTVSVTGALDYNANTVLNELPLAIRRGGYLDRDLRQRSLDKLKPDHNSVGYILEGRVEWMGPACFKLTPNWRPLISVAHHDVAGLSFTKDQYALAFFGNAAYETEKAILAPSSFIQTRYQTIGAGLQHAKTRSFVRLDLVRGQSYASADVQWASLYTSEDGRVLRTALLGDYFASDTAGSGLDRTNGLGAAVSGQWNTRMRIAGKQAILSFGVDDLGLAAWNANSVRIQKDTLFEYTGWEVANIFALDNIVLGEDELLDTFGLRYSTASFTRLLPFRVRIETSMPVSSLWNVGLALDQRNMPGYIPQLTAQASRRLGTRTMLGGTLSYGGSGGLRLGLAAKHRIGKQVLLSLATPQVPGFVSGKVRGLGLSFGIVIGF